MYPGSGRGVDCGDGKGEGRRKTHLPELRHELRVPKDLQPHHLRVLLDRPATPQNTLHRTQFTPHKRSRQNPDAPARSWDVDLSPEQEHRLLSDATLGHRRFWVVEVAPLV